MPLQLPHDPEALAAFCNRHRVEGFYVFGSAVRGDLRPDSDVDVMLAFGPETAPSLFDLGGMQQELEALFGRRVDLVTREAVELMQNPIRRANILAGAERVDAA